MSDPSVEAFAQLFASLADDPTAELILRHDPAGPTATLRRDGAPPRTFVATDAGPEELLPHTDAGLPGRSLLADPTALATVLGAAVGPVAHGRIVAWRPARRAVVRVTLQSGATVWLKLLDRKAWRRAESAFRAVAEAMPPMSLCLPTTLLPDACAYLAAPAAGQSLRCLLAAGRTPPMTVLSRSLMALGYTRLRGELPTLDFAAARRAALDMLQKGAQVRPDLLDVAAQLAGLPAPTAPATPAFVHGDLHDKQLFLTDDGASLIDLEGIACGDARFDLANLAEHVRLRDLQQSHSDQGLADALLARCGQEPAHAATRAFRAVVRARLCGVYALRPRWRELVTHLRQETLDLLRRLP